MQTLDNEVRGCLYGVLEDTSTVEDFEAWFVGRTWAERTPLIVRIDHLLAERALLDDRLLAQELRALATTIEDTDVRFVTTTSSTTETVRPQVIHVGGTEASRSWDLGRP